MEIRVAPPLTGQSVAEGGERPGRQCCWTLRGEADRASGATLRPQGLSVLFLLSPFSHPGNETVGLGHGGSRDSAVVGGSGVPCLGSNGVATPTTLAPMTGPGLPSAHPHRNVSISDSLPSPYL